jgi:Ca-activated chloride channel homolog
MFRFASPLLFLLLIPLLVAAWRVYRRSITKAYLFSPTHSMGSMRRSWRIALAGTLPFLTLIGMALSVIALARPQTVLSITKQTQDVIAVQMVVDVSGSMKALDLSEMKPNGEILRPKTRLDVVKAMFDQFVDSRPDDLIGLVTFGGFATTRCPLTTDHDVLRHVLSGVRLPKPNEIVDDEEMLTAIGDGLATGAARMRDSEAKSRIMVLLSDGESNTGITEPADAVRAAAELGIKVYTIGVGSTGTAKVMQKDRFGRDVLATMRVDLDEDELKMIAAQTGGRYFNVRDEDGLKAALEDIDSLEKTTIEREHFHHYDERFPFFLIPGLAFIVLGTGLNMMACRRLL